MSPFPMRYLLFSVVFCLGCASEYHGLRLANVDNNCIEKILPPPLQTSWFDAGIDVAGKYISGLLLIKEMPDNSDRVVFTNEAGLKFLDFEWKDNGGFTIHYIMKQFDKKAVINLLRKDFELIMGHPFQGKTIHAWLNDDHEFFYGAAQKSGTDYFITGEDCASLLRIESHSGKKRKVSMWLFGEDKSKPDSIRLQHHTFSMKINLKNLPRE